MTRSTKRLLDYLSPVQAGPLLRSDAATLLHTILECEHEAHDAAWVLQEMSKRGVATSEVLGFYDVLRRDIELPIGPQRLAIDICGTGGDAARLFNVSTAAALVVAGAGIPVVKSGNKSYLSGSGSADALAQFNIKLDLSLADVALCVNEVGIGFAFAPAFCPTLKKLAEVRRRLVGPSIFNLVGPLLNPLCQIKLSGAWSPAAQACLFECFQQLDFPSACVVHSADGLDEVSLGAETLIRRLNKGVVEELHVTHESFGLPAYPKETFCVESADESAGVINLVFEGRDLPHRDIIIANAAAVLFHIGSASSLLEGVTMARDSLRGRRAFSALHKLIGFTNV